MERLEAWLDAKVPELGRGPLRLLPASGGATNQIFVLDRGGEPLVLRRPSRDPRPESNALMLREHRVLAALAGSDVPHPRVRAACDDPEVIGANFYVMERVEGFTPRDPLPAPFDRDPEVRRGLAFELVDGAAALARVDWRARGLDGLGKPEGFLERQVGRWLHQLESYERLDGWVRRKIPGQGEVARWLEDNRPAMSPPGILHGDYQFVNTLFRPRAPARLAAIVDWELTTIGDPLLDLAWLMIGWRDPGEPAAAVATIADRTGFPTRREIVRRYEERTGRDASAIDYYAVLARFKLAAILEGHVARNRAGLEAPYGPVMAPIVLDLVAEAREIARRSGAGAPGAP